MEPVSLCQMAKLHKKLLQDILKLGHSGTLEKASKSSIHPGELTFGGTRPKNGGGE